MKARKSLILALLGVFLATSVRAEMHQPIDDSATAKVEARRPSKAKRLCRSLVLGSFMGSILGTSLVGSVEVHKGASRIARHFWFERTVRSFEREEARILNQRIDFLTSTGAPLPKQLLPPAVLHFENIVLIPEIHKECDSCNQQRRQWEYSHVRKEVRFAHEAGDGTLSDELEPELVKTLAVTFAIGARASDMDRPVLLMIALRQSDFARWEQLGKWKNPNHVVWSMLLSGELEEFQKFDPESVEATVMEEMRKHPEDRETFLRQLSIAAGKRMRDLHAKGEIPYVPPTLDADLQAMESGAGFTAAEAARLHATYVIDLRDQYMAAEILRSPHRESLGMFGAKHLPGIYWYVRNSLDHLGRAHTPVLMEAHGMTHVEAPFNKTIRQNEKKHRQVQTLNERPFRLVREK